MFRLRWMFEYTNGTKKVGMWDNSGDQFDVTNKWWANYNNIAYAVIQAKNLQTSEIRDVVRCSHDQFIGFQYMAAALIFRFTNSGNPPTKLTGMKMLTKNEEIEVFNTGKLIRSPVTKSENHFKIHRNMTGGK